MEERRFSAANRSEEMNYLAAAGSGSLASAIWLPGWRLARSPSFRQTESQKVLTTKDTHSTRCARSGQAAQHKGKTRTIGSSKRA